MEKQLFIFRGIDHADSGKLRDGKAVAQREYNLRPADSRMIHGGALYSVDGAPIGTCLVVEAEGLAVARAWIDASPFVESGLFKVMTLERWGSK
ncbi:YciI family protein [Paraburkholderia haematera]|uniref:YCII-related domain-containing protein n=1 Tax=Paraburkholderia haematera TaxID=2793077 RepID=A0ABN7MIX3_9BURK|nr:YciI family protein [Paraburkholderia haematera]CAE6809277.1 hypothetical protein R69888_05584 [Paraburkholderia haematera]